MYFSRKCLFFQSVLSGQSYKFKLWPGESMEMFAMEELVNVPGYVHASAGFIFYWT